MKSRTQRGSLFWKTFCSTDFHYNLIFYDLQNHFGKLSTFYQKHYLKIWSISKNLCIFVTLLCENDSLLQTTTFLTTNVTL